LKQTKLKPPWTTDMTLHQWSNLELLKQPWTTEIT
jgi:hypothetical protein